MRAFVSERGVEEGFESLGGTGMLGQNVIMSGDESAQRATSDES